MTTEILIREITEDDLIFINEVRNDKETRKYLRNTDEISLNETLKWFRNSKPNWYIIEFEKRKVGYIRTSSDTKETICVGCDIHPNERKKGYARSAYNLILEKFYQTGYLLVWLEVFADNFKALSLYRSLNFKETYRYFLKDREAIIMTHVKLGNPR